MNNTQNLENAELALDLEKSEIIDQALLESVSGGMDRIGMPTLCIQLCLIDNCFFG